VTADGRNALHEYSRIHIKRASSSLSEHPFDIKYQCYTISDHLHSPDETPMAVRYHSLSSTTAVPT